MTCGGCEGQGSHKRWCPENVGPTASRLGHWSERAEVLADEVGANDFGASNHLYAASALLLGEAHQARKEWWNR